MFKDKYLFLSLFFGSFSLYGCSGNLNFLEFFNNQEEADLFINNFKELLRDMGVDVDTTNEIELQEQLKVFIDSYNLGKSFYQNVLQIFDIKDEEGNKIKPTLKLMYENEGFSNLARLMFFKFDIFDGPEVSNLEIYSGRFLDDIIENEQLLSFLGTINFLKQEDLKNSIAFNSLLSDDPNFFKTNQKQTFRAEQDFEDENIKLNVVLNHIITTGADPIESNTIDPKDNNLDVFLRQIEVETVAFNPKINMVEGEPVVFFDVKLKVSGVILSDITNPETVSQEFIIENVEFVDFAKYKQTLFNLYDIDLKIEGSVEFNFINNLQPKDGYLPIEIKQVDDFKVTLALIDPDKETTDAGEPSPQTTPDASNTDVAA